MLAAWIRLAEDHHPPMFKHLARHIRLIGSAVAAGILYFLLPRDWPALPRVLVSWNTGVLLFIGLAYHLMYRLDAVQMSKRYEEEDEAAGVILIISVIGSILTMAAIAAFLSSLDEVSGSLKPLHIALAALTVLATWSLIPTMFTLHYADMFYSADPKERPLHFPDTREPVFWDFAYFSFTISAACQTADVSTAQGDIRKLVLAHSVLSFFFNVAVLGFAINVTAGLIGK